MSKRPGKQASISDFFAKSSKPSSESTHSTTRPNVEFSDDFDENFAMHASFAQSADQEKEYSHKIAQRTEAIIDPENLKSNFEHVTDMSCNNNPHLFLNIASHNFCPPKILVIVRKYKLQVNR